MSRAARVLLIQNLSGPGSIVKTGGGRASLVGAFSGPIDVQAGEIGGDMGGPASPTTLRAGTSAYHYADRGAEPFVVDPGSLLSPTTIARGEAASIKTTGVGHVRVRDAVVSGPISGPGSIHVTSANQLTSTFSGDSTYTGGTWIEDSAGLEISGPSVLGTGPVYVGGLLVLAEDTYVPNDVTVDGGRLYAIADGPEIAGTLTLDSDTVLGQGTPDGLLVLSGAIAGPGTLDVSNSTADIVLTGEAPNVNDGISLTGHGTPRLWLDKPAGVSAVSGTLKDGWWSEVIWLNDEQIDDQAALDIQGTLYLGGATETVRSLSLTGGTVVLSDGASTTSGRLVTSRLHASGSSTLVFGSTPSSDDSIVVSESVTLESPTLEVSHLVVGDAEVALISVAGTSSVSGTFDGLPEGATVDAAEQTLRISYKGGDGNDVVLTPISFGSLVPARLLDSRMPSSPTIDGRFQAIGRRSSGSGRAGTRCRRSWWCADQRGGGLAECDCDWWAGGRVRHGVAVRDADAERIESQLQHWAGRAQRGAHACRGQWQGLPLHRNSVRPHRRRQRPLQTGSVVRFVGAGTVVGFAYCHRLRRSMVGSKPSGDGQAGRCWNSMSPVVVVCRSTRRRSR